MTKKRALITSGILLLLITAAVALAWRKIFERPSLNSYRELFEAPANESAKVRVTFLGVTTLLIDDGETAFMTDGFFSRPPFKQVMTKNIGPNEEVIAETLKKFNIVKLAAVIPIHSHYDHAMDAPSVALRTGALLVGSNSTANIGRGYGLEEKQIRVVKFGDTLTFGKFKVTFIMSKHVATPAAEGTINYPLYTPARVRLYMMGECYALLIEHEGRSFLLNGSAGFVPGALKNYRAETVYLGVGRFGIKNEADKADYWREVVANTGAKRVRIVHWDNFTSPLSEPLQVIAYAVDDFASTIEFLKRQGAKDGVEIRMPVFGQIADPFAEQDRR